MIGAIPPAGVDTQERQPRQSKPQIKNVSHDKGESLDEDSVQLSPEALAAAHSAGAE